MADRNTKIRGNQVRDLTITNDDIAVSAGIQESKLSLNYPTHSNSLDHTPDTDQYLDFGGLNQVAVADVKTAVEDTHEHANLSALDDVEGVNTGDQTASTVPTSETGVSVQDALDALEGFTVTDYVSFELANETPNGAIVEFTYDSASIATSVQVFLNGLLQQEGSGKDYVLDNGNKKATFVIAPDTGDIVAFSYFKS